VAQGDVVARLDGVNAGLAVRQAEAAVATARAQLALIQAPARPEEIAAAEAGVAAAQDEVTRTLALRAQLKAGAEAEAAGAQAQLEGARAAYQQALITIGQSDDEDDRKQLNALTLRVRAAEARVAAWPSVLAARVRAADAGVQATQAQVAAAQAELALLVAPATAEEIAVAEAEIRQAEAALATAQVALARTELRAPFDGVVTQTPVEVGETVGVGQPILILADLDHLRLATIDLMELDVAALEEGQAVQITVDALPGRGFTGHIRQIKDQSSDYRGDVTYPLLITLDDVAPELRWGMRAMVEIPRP
jgi:multidrug resistance efflux pump